MVAATRTIKHKLDQTVALARGLAAAPNLEHGDLTFFETRMRKLLEPFGYFLVLSEPGSAQEIFNTTVATGKPALPPEWVQELEDTQEPIVRPFGEL